MAQYTEGQRLQGSDGKIYVVHNGVPSIPANAPSLTDPRLQYQVQTAQGQAAAAPFEGPKAQADAATAQAQARIAEANAAVANAKNTADLEAAKVNLAKTQAELAQLQAGKGSALDALQAQVDRTEELYRQNVQGGLPNPIFGHLPFPSYGQFDSAAQGLVNPFQSAFRVPGAGSQSDTELRQFIQANTPDATDPDKVIEEKLRNIQTRVDAERATRGQPSPTSSNPLPPIASPDQTGLATGKTRDVADPVLRATGQRVGAMIAKGLPDAQILDFLQKSGVNPSDTSIGEALQFRKTDDFKRWQRTNPGAAYPIGPNFYTKQVPMSGGRSLFNKVSQNGAVGDAEAAIIASGNAFTGDRGASAIGALSGDPEAAKTGMQLLRTNHPASSLGGDIAGQALFEAALGRVPGASALMASRWGRRGADALYGGYYGSGDDSGGDPLGGGAGGAATNMFGGMFGRGIQKGAGRTLSGVKNASLQYLDNAGVPLTIGQIGRGSENTLGHIVGGVEERLRGLPGFDAVIGAARQRGDRGFNTAAFREAGGSGATGASGLAEVAANRDNAYKFLDPVDLPLDAPFAGSQAGVRASIPDMPAYGEEVSKGLDLINSSSRGGAISGRDWRSALSDTRGNRSSIAGQPFSGRAISGLKDVEQNLMGLAQRQGPAGTLDSLTAANRLHGQVETLASALDNGPAQKAGELFSAGRLDDVARAGARKFGGRTASLTGNRPFYQLTSAGKEVMPSLTPDSGTAGRLLLYPLVAGAGGGAYGAITGDDRLSGGADGAGRGAAMGMGLLALSGAYGKNGQKIIQKALLGDRSDRIVKIGDFLINHARLGGMFGAGAARDYVYQPELPR